MENLEKLEIPTIEFTKVTLMGIVNSICNCPGYHCTYFDISTGYGGKDGCTDYTDGEGGEFD